MFRTTLSATVVLVTALLTLSVAPAIGARREAPDSMTAEAVVQTFTVTSAADNPDANIGNGACADSVGLCTLRAAITEANSIPGDDRIEFRLTGTAPVTIQLSSRLPNISSPNGSLTIDGYSQPGSQVNTATIGSNARMGVEIRGNGQAARETAFFITSAGNTIRGVLINTIWRGVWLEGAGAHDNWIIGNWMGFQKNGTNSRKANAGVILNWGAHHNHIGAPTLADRNVIGNFIFAEESAGPGTDFNVTQNNVLCIRPGGFGRAPCSTAIDHNFGPKHHLVGGFGPNEKNVIGPTSLQGIELSHGFNPTTHEYNETYAVSDNQVIGNWIGFRGDGSYDPTFRSGQMFTAPDSNGINVFDGANDNLVEGNYVASVYDGIQVGLYSPYAVGNTVRNNFIGVSPLGQNAPLAGWGIISRGNVHHNIFVGNTISNAGRGGVGLTNTDNNGKGQIPASNTRISQNIITDTNGPAIDLFGVAGAGGAGPDPNDPGDVDTGANTRLNTPVFTKVNTAGASGTAYAGSTVELFRASRPVGQFGLPTAYLGSAIVAANGTWTIPVTLALGDVVTALQIRPNLNTSELAANVATVSDSSLLVDDHFSRTSVNTWGSAPTGGAYTLQGTADDYDVNGTAGTMALTSAGANRSAVLTGVSVLGVDVSFRVATNKNAVGGAQYVYGIGRRINSTTEYRTKLRLAVNGNVFVQATSVVSNVETAIGTEVQVPGLTYSPGSFIWLRAQFSGTNPTTIRIRAWADGSTEPGTWQYTATNAASALQAPGAVGLRGYLSGPATNAPVILTFDDFWATDIAP